VPPFLFEIFKEVRFSETYDALVSHAPTASLLVFDNPGAVIEFEAHAVVSPEYLDFQTFAGSMEIQKALFIPKQSGTIYGR
jgi:hypothetical protein